MDCLLQTTYTCSHNTPSTLTYRDLKVTFAFLVVEISLINKEFNVNFLICDISYDS